jgi:putative nucleotidyltransferase with HDIG domain
MIDLSSPEAALAAIGVTAAELAATPQSPTFHAEGDVWLHTRMALEALAASAAYTAASPAERDLLYAAVLFHDIGKPSTTRIEPDGAITSRGHSTRGERIARVALWRAGVPFAFREHLCALIRHHQMPFFTIDRPAAEAAAIVARMSFVTRNRWLAAVADADGRGRRCLDPADHRRIVDNVALYLELAAEHGALDTPRAFADPHTRAVWLAAPAGRAPLAPAYDDTTCEVVVTSGLPAAGKSTWLAAHRPELPVVSLDELRHQLDVDPEDPQAPVVAAARELARGHLRAGRSFAWSATSLSKDLRGQVIELCRGYRARVHVVYVETPAAEHARRNRARPERSRVPAAAIDRMLSRWSVPTPDEAHAVSYVVDDGIDGKTDDGWTWPPAGV